LKTCIGKMEHRRHYLTDIIHKILPGNLIIYKEKNCFHLGPLFFCELSKRSAGYTKQNLCVQWPAQACSDVLKHLDSFVELLVSANELKDFDECLADETEDCQELTARGRLQGDGTFTVQLIQSSATIYFTSFQVVLDLVEAIYKLLVATLEVSLEIRELLVRLAKGFTQDREVQLLDKAIDEVKMYEGGLKLAAFQERVQEACCKMKMQYSPTLLPVLIMNCETLLSLVTALCTLRTHLDT